jgi:transposase
MKTTGSNKPRRPRRAFTPEFKAEIVEQCQRGDRRARVGQAGRTRHGDPRGRRAEQRGEGRTGRVAAGERRLREDVEILKRATAFFAKETR